MNRSGAPLPASVVAVREELARQRDLLRSAHDQGLPGVQLGNRLAGVFDRAIEQLIGEARQRGTLDPSIPIALVAHGGYGRRDVAPYSDVDLMVLHGERNADRIQPFARYLSQSIYDTGLKLGFSVRTAGQAVAESLRDVRVATSLVESRLAWGDETLYRTYLDQLHRRLRRRAGILIDQVERARRDERRQYGDTVYLLEPNVKRSRGTLRDIQLVRWIGGIRFGQTDLQRLVRAGSISHDDFVALQGAWEFLLHLRNELHFRADQSQDVLTREEQLRIAEQRGFQGTAAERPVEAFMRTYYEQTVAVRDASRHCLEGARSRSRVGRVLEPALSHRVGEFYRVGPAHIRATRKGLARVTEDLEEVLRLMDLANAYNKQIGFETWRAIRRAMQRRGPGELSPSVAERFLSFLGQPARLAPLLRRLHELRVLEILVPPMRHARCLVQFNEYHKYTVDEHCILAVQRATEFFSRNDALGHAYRSLKRRHLLHLALLLHDLGKGFPGDHSEIGGHLAAETAQRLNLSSRESAMLRALVEKHLLMSDLALRHDINDEATWLQLAMEVGSPYMLQMLYVLTCADLAAVGPGVLNDWKLTLITNLYERTREHLTGELGDRPGKTLAEQRRHAVRDAIGKREDAEWWRRHAEELPVRFLLADEPQRIVEALERLHDLPRAEARAWGEYRPQERTTVYTVVAHESIVEGVFHRLTGALTSRGLDILSAEIHTLADGLVLDRFHVEDGDFEGAPPATRIDDISRALVDALERPTSEPPVFRRLWQPRAARNQSQFQDQPTRVRFDNATSDRFTIITLFAYDRTGLLYDATHCLFQLGLSVHVAKIGTHLDQVTDVFYVVDRNGRKIEAETTMDEIRQALIAAIGG